VFFILSKVLDFLLRPVVWILLLLVLGLVLRKASWKRGFLLSGMLLLLFFTNPFIVNEAWLAWEVPPRPMHELPRMDAGIVLTGIGRPDKSPHDRVHLNKGADRLLHALQLYREGRIGKIILSGGTGSFRKEDRAEAEQLRRILLLAQVPDEDILLETRSMNTRENALYTRDLLQQHPEIQSVVLISSAFHLRRAAACFRKVGVEVTPFATDFYTHDRRFTPATLVEPGEMALHSWQKLIHEISGYLVYALMGYV
jgi:uncharacterized SAM-binding protein YcdF (DUF218 family)